MQRSCTWMFTAYLALSLAGCGGGGSNGGGTTTHTVGGIVSGLTGAGLVLQNNAGNNLSVNANGAFTFSTALASGVAFAVTVLTQPVAQNCTVSNGSGTVTRANITNVGIACAAITFKPVTSTMTSPRILHTATLVTNGEVLLTGGLVDGSLGAALDTAELYNPTTNTFTAITARMTSVRNQHTATRLPNGQVLIAGGSNHGNGDGMNTAELYDPATQTFTALAATMTTPRGGYTATLLPNGQVLLAGGFFNDSVSLNSAELYDPTAQSFTALPGTMTSRRSLHTATLLPNGQVLFAGGGSADTEVNTAELYEPATQTFTALGVTMTTIRAAHTATLLPGGQVLVAGGTANVSPTNFTALGTTELYDPIANAFTALPSTLGTPRGGHAATLLSNGGVLLTGGGTGTNSVVIVINTAEVYGP